MEIVYKASVKEAGLFGKLISDYLEDHDALKSFHRGVPSPENYKNTAAAILSQDYNRTLLTDVIDKQYRHSSSALPQQLISKLRAKDSLTVCTGHQLVLAGSPLFFIYKIATVIKLAEELEKELQHPVVPVFWMASEDHDIDEIRTISLFGKKIIWNTSQQGPAGNLTTDDLEEVVSEIETVLGDKEENKRLSSQIRNIYKKGRTLADATRDLVHTVFHDRVVVLDASSHELKREFISVMADDLLKQSAYASVTASVEKIEKMGYAAQVNPRPVNLFYIDHHSRERIEVSGDGWKTVTGSRQWNKEMLLQELNSHPERFSPNVVLRPLYQQHLLPNIGYIGGPGELAYWLEFRAMFDFYQIQFPVLHPRFSACLADNNTIEKFTKLGFEVSDMLKETEELVRDFAKREGGENLDFSKEQEQIKVAFHSTADKAAAIDVTLRKSAEAELQKTLNALEVLQNKTLKAQKQKQELSVNQIRKIKEKFFPEGQPQERVESTLPWLTNENFITQLIDHIQPWEAGFNVIVP